MTADSRMLLKMLEPVVRPGQTGGPVRQPVVPLEQQSFESLLGSLQADAASSDQLVQGAQATWDKPKPASPLSDLARVDQIQNVSLRNLIASAGKAGSIDGSGGGSGGD